MEFAYASYFNKRFKKLHPDDQAKVKNAIASLFDYFDRKNPLPAGLGLKNLRGDLWEIRVGIRTRIIFELSDKIIFWLVGSHDEISRFIHGK